MWCETNRRAQAQSLRLRSATPTQPAPTPARLRISGGRLHIDALHSRRTYGARLGSAPTGKRAYGSGIPGFGSGCDERPGGVRRVQTAQPSVARADPSSMGDCEVWTAKKAEGVRISARPRPMWREGDQRWARIWCGNELAEGAGPGGVRIIRDDSEPRWAGDQRGRGTLVRDRATPMAWPGARGYPPSRDPISGESVDYANKRYGGLLSTKAAPHLDVVKSRIAALAAETAPNQSMMFRGAGEYHY